MSCYVFVATRPTTRCNSNNNNNTEYIALRGPDGSTLGIYRVHHYDDGVLHPRSSDTYIVGSG